MPESGTERCWDHEDCPRDGCDGELQQQDRFNVMCLKCERVFTHQKDDDEHRLIHDCEFVARKPRSMTDGGEEIWGKCSNCGRSIPAASEECADCLNGDDPVTLSSFEDKDADENRSVDTATDRSRGGGQ